MSLIVRQSTAVVVSFGPFLDKTDGVTLEVGLVSAIDHATTGIFLSKNGGALAIRSQAVTASTYDAYGNYRVTLSTTDTNTIGTLRMQFSEAATCLPVWQDFIVVDELVYDVLFGTVALATTTNITAGTITTVGTLTTYTGNTPQTGDVFPLASTEIADIKTKTDFLPSVTAGAAGGLFIAGANAATSITTALTANITGNLSGSVGSVTGAVGSVTGAVGSVTGLTAATVHADLDDIQAKIGTPAGVSVSADIAALNNLSAAQVNAEVVDALATDTYAEPTGVPAATVSLASKIGRLHQALRNAVTVTATKKQFFDDAGVALWEKDLSDDETTYTETEGNLP